MKPRIRMIAVDLDGTLLNSQKCISETDLEALRQATARGIEIVPVTGRNYAFALRVVQTLPFDPAVISSNGALIRSLDGETFFRCLLPVETARHILEVTREFRAYTVVMYDQVGAGLLRIEAAPDGGPGPATESLRAEGVAASAWVRRNQSLVRYVPSLEEALDGDPLEVMFAGPVAVIRAVETRLGSGRQEMDSASRPQTPEPAYRSLLTEYREQDFSILDLIHADCSKGHALEHWSRRRGVSPAEIMAIGDNYNDLEMLRFAGLPVVMGNAEESLQRQGWARTLDCDSSGVGHAIQKYAL
ncbi:MAG: HAD family phosphatase [Acidobacteria bacterium]|nr:HAD family phosphatase [Acidobacteriota bacterium]